MANGKLTEFITVLLTAVVVGGGAYLIIRYLEGTERFVGMMVLVAVVIGLFKFLRRRFGRG